MLSRKDTLDFHKRRIWAKRKKLGEYLISGETNPAASNPGDLNCQVSKEIEDEANSYFQRIYNHPPHPTLSIDEILDLLKKFQDSPNKRERVSIVVDECFFR